MSAAAASAQARARKREQILEGPATGRNHQRKERDMATAAQRAATINCNRRSNERKRLEKGPRPDDRIEADDRGRAV